MRPALLASLLLAVSFAVWNARPASADIGGPVRFSEQCTPTGIAVRLDWGAMPVPAAAAAGYGPAVAQYAAGVVTQYAPASAPQVAPHLAPIAAGNYSAVYIDVSLTGTWGPGAFTSYGPINPAATGTIIPSLQPGVTHYFRLALQRTDGKWVESPAIPFTTVPACSFGNAHRQPFLPSPGSELLYPFLVNSYALFNAPGLVQVAAYPQMHQNYLNDWWSYDWWNWWWDYLP